ncbi:hypothetical protein LWI29_035481 [Acer saccharum]|uniref:Uncharacterized protein n=1 Tax=Acer saccharum TaxID=4024 RepID=A0AA39VWL3_ACESA|nr:hypothetical protein LWI29_035481 [Acer saccharum]
MGEIHPSQLELKSYVKFTYAMAARSLGLGHDIDASSAISIFMKLSDKAALSSSKCLWCKKKRLAVCSVSGNIPEAFRKESYIITGTDERGEKIAAAAAAGGSSPSEHCDVIKSQSYKILRKYVI